MRSLPPIKHLEQWQKSAYEAVDEAALVRLRCAEFSFSLGLGGTRQFVNVWTYSWVYSELSDLTEVTGLALSAVAGLSLLFGLLQDDDEWLLPEYARLLCREAERFLAWLDSWVIQVTAI